MSEIEDQVIALIVKERPAYSNVETCCRARDRSLGDRLLLVGRQY